MGCDHKSAREQEDFVTDAVKDLLGTGCILIVDNRPFICRPLSVVEGSNKKRLVINLRYLTSLLWKQKFKYEDLRTALLLRTYLRKVIWLLPLILNLGITMWRFMRVVRNTWTLDGILKIQKLILYLRFFPLGCQPHVISLLICYVP